MNFQATGELTGLDSAATKAPLEAINPTTAIKNFLLAGIEWVTLRTYFNENVFTQRGLGFDHVATATGSLDWAVGWMDVWFHDFSSQWMSPHRIQTDSMHHICFCPEPGATTGSDQGACILTEKSKDANARVDGG